MRRLPLIAILLLLTPAVCQAAESALDQDQARLYSVKLLEILSPVGIAIFGAVQFLVAFLAAVLSARICFGADSVWVRTIKWYIYSFLGAIGIGLMVVVLAMVAQQMGLLIGGLLALLLLLVMLFAIPMHVFDASFLRTLLFIVVLVIANAISSVVSTFVVPMLFGDKGEQIRLLTEDLENRRIRADKDYSKLTKGENVEEEEVPAPVSRPMTLKEEAAALNLRFAALKDRFAKLDKTNAAEVTQYNLDYKRYTDDLNAYNARAKAAQPVAPGP